MLFVAHENPGMETKPIDTMGGRETAYVYLTDCEVSEDAVLGEVDQAWMQLMAGLNTERLILGATILGIGQRAFDDALAYVKERNQFGRPIGSFQALQHRLAEMATQLEAAKLMTYWVASLNDEDPTKMLPREASMVKLYATEVAKRVSLDGMQLMGGYGYSSEYEWSASSARLWSRPSTAGPRRSRRTSSPRPWASRVRQRDRASWLGGT
jgi:alkylation response protein AidB-like acyl-CoA dehydrogenase